jgi:hypothetical protein
MQRITSTVASRQRACGLAALMLVAGSAATQPAWAQAGLNCQTVEADVQAEQPTSLPTVSGPARYTFGDRTSEQIIQQWATIQDPDPEACRLMKEVQRRLASEDSFARRACPDVISGLRNQTELAKGEASILCRGRD